MEPQPPKEAPPSYFGGILALNLAVVVVLHAARRVLAPQEHIYALLFGLVFINFIMMFVFSSLGQGDNAMACLLAAFLVALVGFSDCTSPLAPAS